MNTFFLICCGLFIFSAQYLAHYFVAHIFKFKPKFYYKKGLASITYRARPLDLFKITFILLIGPVIEMYFILFGLVFNIREIILTGCLFLLTDVYVFKKLYDLYRLKDHYRMFGYFGT